jgi:hypothetical protein
MPTAKGSNAKNGVACQLNGVRVTVNRGGWWTVDPHWTNTELGGNRPFLPATDYRRTPRQRPPRDV